MSRFLFSRPSIISSFLAILGFLLGLGLLLVTSEGIVLLPISLQDGIVRLPSAFGPDMDFLIGYFVCFAAAGGILGFTFSRKEKHGTKQRTNLCQPPPFTSRRSFTLVELLIVIAVIAVLATVVILALNPGELLRQARDANRVSDMKTLEQALNLYAEDVGGDMGTSSVVYVSVPDPLATTAAGSDCSGIGLSSSSLPTGWAYHCTGPSFYKNPDGTGWIPVDFKAASFGTPLGTLPVDPANTNSSGLYYAYVTNGDLWELTSNMESQKYGMGGSNDVVTKDGGQYPDLYEIGTDLSLDPIDYNPLLVGYWKLDEGSGTVAYDQSGHGNDGTWYGTQAGTSSYYSAGHNQTWAGTFDGTDDYINRAVISDITSDFLFTVTAWFKTSVSSGGIFGTNVGGCYRPVNICVGYVGSICPGSAGIANASAASSLITSNVGVNNGSWQSVALEVDASHETIYINGLLKDQVAIGGTPLGFSSNGTFIGAVGNGSCRPAGFFSGDIEKVRVYNRALSASEIAAIYNAEK